MPSQSLLPYFGVEDCLSWLWYQLYQQMSPTEQHVPRTNSK